jgi:hypothetical protein
LAEVIELELRISVIVIYLLFVIWNFSPKLIVSSLVKLEAAARGSSEPLYETTPEWHSFFNDQTGRFTGQRLG